MGMKLFAADVERIARWAHGSRQGKPITAHTIGTWIQKDELKATKASNTEWKRQTHRTNERGQVEVTDTSPWEIDLDDLERHPKVAIDRQQLADLEAERKRGTPDETVRRIAVTEERMAAMEARISELEHEREALMHRINTLEGERATMRVQIDSVLARLDEPTVSPVKHLNENTFFNAPVTRYDDPQSASYFQPTSEPSLPYMPAPPIRAQPAAPLYAGITSQVPVTRIGSPRKDTRPSRDPAKRRITDTPELPDDLYGFARLVEAHGISATTAKDQWIEQHLFQVTGPYKIGRNPKAWAIDEANATEAIRLWIHFGRTGAMQKVNMASFGNCGVSTANGIRCPCYRLVDRVDTTN